MRAYRKRRVLIVYEFRKGNGDFGKGDETFSFIKTQKLTPSNIDEMRLYLLDRIGAASLVITNIVYL